MLKEHLEFLGIEILEIDQIDKWFYIFLSWVSAGFFGEEKIDYIYQAMSENCFLILKPFLALCLLNYLIALKHSV